jgi:hypothetical protein
MIRVPSTAVLSKTITRAADGAPAATIAPRGCSLYVDFDTQKVRDFWEAHASGPAYADQVSLRPK